MDKLFRQEVIDYQSDRLVGDIVVITPPSTKFLVLFFSVVAILIIGFMFLVETSGKTLTSGYLVPENGLIKISSPKDSTVYSLKVNEGDIVDEGQPLLILSTEIKTQLLESSKLAVIEKIEQRKEILYSDLNELLILEEKNRNSLIKNKEDRIVERDLIKEEIILKVNHIDLSEKSLNRGKKLLKKNYISISDFQKLEAELINLKAEEKALRRSFSEMSREINTIEFKLGELPLDFKNRESELRQKINLLEQELIEYKSEREMVITAPKAGRVGAIFVESGANVFVSDPLLQILPDDSRLQAQLYANSKSIGFIRSGQEVKLRYHAFPYQKFGHQTGYVTAISHAAIRSEDLGLNVSGISNSVYKITVSLEKQNIIAYGESRALLPGMQLEADVLLDKRKVIEWIFEPLISISGHI